MTFIHFKSRKLFAVIVILLILFIFYKYHNILNTIDSSYQHFNYIETARNLNGNSENDVTNSKRIKRFLFFQGGGVVKLVFGTSLPIIMADKKRSLNYFYNFQIQYVPPPIPLYWWSFYNTTTFVARTNAHKRLKHMVMHYDKSRTYLYDFLETVFQRACSNGNFAKECLLKVICEVARAPLSEDLHKTKDETMPLGIKENIEILDDYGLNIYHEIINAIFTPLHLNVHERYINARTAGQNGINCDKTFGECPIVEKLFERYTQFT